MSNDAKVRLSIVHGNVRSVERRIGTPEIRDVILYGYREEDQDMFDVESYPDVVIVTVMHVYP